MAYETVQVRFSADEVSTLDELGQELKRLYGWKSFSVDGDHIVFEANDTAVGRVKKGYVGTSGFAFYLEKAEDDRFEELSSWSEYDVNWDEDFDSWNNHVWGEDDEGNTVMVHD